MKEPSVLKDDSGGMFNRVELKLKNKVNLDEDHDEATKMKDTLVDNDNGNFSFEKSFLSLGSAMHFMLDDVCDMKSRTFKANKVMGDLSFAQKVHRA